MKSIANRLVNMIEEQGWKCRIVPISRLADLQEAIYGRHEQGLFDERLYREQLGFFSFAPPPNFPDARSIIIIAVPTPQMRITFHWHGEPMRAVVPPTYVSFTPRIENVQAVIKGWLQQGGYSLAKPLLPLKTLGVHSGLAAYGRNNICYVPGMGSFLQLVGAFSDLSCDHDPWVQPKMLDRCNSCTACLRRCPTGAITRDRFLIHAERCLTYHNEAADEFPDWIAPTWHHCLIGCMRCQTACPENRRMLKWVEDRGEFSEEETRLMNQQTPLNQLPADLAAKLKSLEINEDYRLLCRNLSMILEGDDGPY